MPDDAMQGQAAVPPQPDTTGLNPSWTASTQAPVLTQPTPIEPVGQAAPFIEPTQTPMPTQATTPTPATPEPTLPASEPPTIDPGGVSVPVVTANNPVEPQLAPAIDLSAPAAPSSPSTAAADAPIVPPQSSGRRWLIIVIVVLVLGAIIGLLMWQGILFGSPKNGTVALAKMTAALGKTPAFHVTGTASLTLQAHQTTAYLGEQVKVLAATDVVTTPSATATCTSTTTPCTASQTVIAGSPTATMPDTCGDSCSTAPPPRGTTTTTAVPTTSPTVSTDSTPLPTLTPLGTSAATASAGAAQATATAGTAAASPVQISATFSGDRASATSYDLTSQIDLSKLTTSILPSTLPNTLDSELKTINGQGYWQAPFVAQLVGASTSGWFKVDPAKADKTLPIVHPDQLAGIMKSGTRVGYEHVGPITAAHYHFQIDPTMLANLIAASVPTGESLGTTINQSQAALDLWLGKSDNLPYKLNLSVQLPNQPDQFRFVLDANLSNFAKATTLTPPADSDLITQTVTGIDYTHLADSLKKKSRDATRKTDLTGLKSALETYKTQQGHYIATDGKLTKTNDPKSLLHELVDKGYLTKLPTDPSDPTYWYGYRSDTGDHYELFSILEDTTDPQGQTSNGFTVYKLTDQSQAVSTSTSAKASVGLPGAAGAGAGQLPSAQATTSK